MKTKLTLLAATLVIGFGSISATASPPSLDFYGVKVTPAVRAAHEARMPGLKPCCNTSTRYTANGIKGGIVVNRDTACNNGCAIPHAQKNCSIKERKQCVN